MEFTKYRSLHNSYQKLMIDRIIEQSDPNDMWVVQEKAHGANFSFHFEFDGNGREISCKVANRRKFLEDDELEGFYNSHICFDRNVDKLRSFCGILMDWWNCADCADKVIFYGELIGGTYPGVETSDFVKKQKVVQGGVYYSPNVEFYLFDVAFVAGESVTFLDPLSIHLYCSDLYILSAKILFEGTLEECLNYDNSYNSTIPQWIDYLSKKNSPIMQNPGHFISLPTIEKNICEGNVIKPMKPFTLKCGSRPVIKNKNDIWGEGIIKNKNNKPEASNEILNLIDTLICENRVRAAISKIGDPTMENFGKTMKEFFGDCSSEMAESGYDKNTIKAFKKLGSKKASRMLHGMIEG